MTEWQGRRNSNDQNRSTAGGQIDSYEPRFSRRKLSRQERPDWQMAQSARRIILTLPWMCAMSIYGYWSWRECDARRCGGRCDVLHCDAGYTELSLKKVWYCLQSNFPDSSPLDISSSTSIQMCFPPLLGICEIQIPARLTDPAGISACCR